MSEQDLLRAIEEYYPRGSKLSPVEMGEFFGDFFAQRGLKVRFSYLRQHELTQELISRIKISLIYYIEEISKVTGYGVRTAKNTYYQMVFAILNHHHYGIVNNKKQLKRITFPWFANEFGVNRKTLSARQGDVNFYNSKRAIKVLRDIFFRVENDIINK